MGEKMGPYDIFICIFLCWLNLRFGPSQTDEQPDWLGGIDEMAALQREFGVFQEGRSFARSVALLNLGGFYNPAAKKRWYSLLEDLKSYPSDQPDEDGDVRIVRALIANLKEESPLPVHFKAHLSEDPNTGIARRMVIVRRPDRPLFYMDRDYITVSFPMKPRPKRIPGRAARPRTRRPK